MKRNRYTLADTHTYVASTTTRVEIPTSGYITLIECLVHLNVTAATPTPAEDPMAQLIKGCRIRASGGKNFFDITDGRQWKYRNHFKYAGQIQEDDLPGTTDTDDCYFELPIHLGLNVRDPYDPSVVIPARNLSNLIHEVTWGADTDLGTALTINSGDMTLTVNELTLEPGELETDIWRRGIVEPRFEARQISIAAVYSNLGLEDEVPVGDTLYETGMVVLAAAGTRSDADITEMGVKFPKRRETPVQVSWANLKAASRRRFRVPADVVGASLYPWKEVSGRDVGLDLKLAMVGDCRMGFSSSLGTGTLHLLHYAIG